MLISNHISWLDTVIILNLCYLSYIGKVEMLKWIPLRPILKAGQTIFIDRQNKRSMVNINQQVANILPFKSSVLEASIQAQSRMIPVVLRYRKESNQLAKEVSFINVEIALIFLVEVNLLHICMIKLLETIKEDSFIIQYFLHHHRQVSDPHVQ